MFEARETAGDIIAYGMMLFAAILLISCIAMLFGLFMGVFSLLWFAMAIIFSIFAYIGLWLYTIIAPGRITTSTDSVNVVGNDIKINYDPNCNGSGRCQYCRGTGFNGWTGSHALAKTTCKFCLGTGVCRYCRGSGGSVNKW